MNRVAEVFAFSNFFCQPLLDLPKEARNASRTSERIPVVALRLAATRRYMFSGGVRQATAYAKVTAGSVQQHTSGLYSPKHMEEMDALR